MSKDQKCQTWAERLEDKGKAALAPEFVETMMLTAYENRVAVDDLWIRWRTYVQTCSDMDQSGVFREFCQWNKLTGAGPLA